MHAWFDPSFKTSHWATHSHKSTHCWACVASTCALPYFPPAWCCRSLTNAHWAIGISCFHPRKSCAYAGHSLLVPGRHWRSMRCKLHEGHGWPGEGLARSLPSPATYRQISPRRPSTQGCAASCCLDLLSITILHVNPTESPHLNRYARVPQYGPSATPLGLI